MADMQTVLAAATPTEVQPDPFPHLIKPEAIPRDTYQHIQALFPELDTIIGKRRSVPENAAARLSARQVLDNPAIAPEWREFFAVHVSNAFWGDIVRVFGAALRETFPHLEERVGRCLGDFRVGVRGDAGTADVRLECQFVVNTPSTQPSSVKTPHVDKRQTIFAGLFYLRDPEDRSEGGDLEFYTWKQAPRFLHYRMILLDDVAPYRRIAHAPNTLACFINSERSVHGVSPRTPSTRARRYINLIAELPFHAFTIRSVSLPVRILHWQQVRRVRRKQIGKSY